jgi:hypothetical protein
MACSAQVSSPRVSALLRQSIVLCLGAIVLAAAPPLRAQATQSPAGVQSPAAATPAPAAAPDSAASAPAGSVTESTKTVPAASPAAEEVNPTEPQAGAITEEELRGLLVGKPLYLRSLALDNSLSFNEHGQLLDHSPRGSYTLSGLEIEKVHLTKHKLELEGTRYGLHFVGQLAYEDPSKAAERVRITPKKKVVKISIDREMVLTPKKKKEAKGKKAEPAAAASKDAPEPSEADEKAASIAAVPAAEQPSDAKSVTTTLSPAHAARVLREALDNIFAPGLDDRMMAALPDFWKLYYDAAARHTDYRPKDPSVLRQSTVDHKARLLTVFEPPSNEYAQANGVAGMALYHTIIGADGKAGEIAVARPIGFGLDENAADSIRKARFEPAVKDGKPVPVLLDLVVQFHIYSKRTAVAGTPEAGSKTEDPVLPGPYSVGKNK